MVDWQVDDGVRRRKPHIDGDPSATGGTGAQTTPGQHTGACRTAYRSRHCAGPGAIFNRLWRGADALAAFARCSLFFLNILAYMTGFRHEGR